MCFDGTLGTKPSDLIYLDLFNSKASCNVPLFAEEGGSRVDCSDRGVWRDTWRWDHGAAAHQEVQARPAARPLKLCMPFRHLLSDNNILAYLTKLCWRLVWLSRVAPRKPYYRVSELGRILQEGDSADPWGLWLARELLAGGMADLAEDRGIA
jgi:hypothetical protein